MKYLFILLLYLPHISYARIHTVLDSKTIANYKINNHIKKSKSINQKFDNLIAIAANKHNIDEKLIHAIIKVESSYNPLAVSPKGAIGLMQLMPDTAKRFGVTDISNPKQNINGGTKYLKYLTKIFHSDLKLIIAAYNAGENAIIKYDNNIPPYPETKEYVNQVISLYNTL